MEGNIGSVPGEHDAYSYEIPGGDGWGKAVFESSDALLACLEESCLRGGMRLPVQPIPSPPRPRTSNRGTWGRFRRARKLWSTAEIFRNAINDVWSGHAKKRAAESEGLSKPRRVKITDDVSRTWSKILVASQTLMTARRVSEISARTGVLVWALLRKGVTDLHGRLEDQVKYVDFVGNLIQELPEHSGKADLLGALPGTVATVYADVRNILKSLTVEEEAEFEAVRQRYGHVGGREEEFAIYLRREDVSDYWCFKTQEELEAGIAWASAAVLAVPRRKDHYQRKILACVPAGLLIKRIKEMFPNNPGLTSLGMYGGTSLGIIEADEGRLRYAGIDETQAFTSVVLPPGHAELQCGPLMKVQDIPVRHRRPEWTMNQRVRACYKRMAMGRSDSVFLLMSIHLKLTQEAVRRFPRLRDFTILNLLGVRLSGCRVRGSRGAIYIHVTTSWLYTPARKLQTTP